MSEDIPQELKVFREQIDALDHELLEILAKRFQIVRNVGHMKVRENMEIVQSERAKTVKDRAVALAIQKGIPENFIAQFYDMMIDEAHIIEHAIVDEQKKGKS